MVYGLDSLCLPLDSLHMPASLLLDLLVAAAAPPHPIAPSVSPDLCQACQTDLTLARPRSASFRCVAVVAAGHPSAKG